MKIAAHIRYILLAVILFTVHPPVWGQTTRYYVNTTNGSNNSGDDPTIAHQGWAFACTDLQKVIDAAYQSTGGSTPVEIWVAGNTTDGYTYYPQWIAKSNTAIAYDSGTAGTSGTARDRAFVMRPNVHIYGSFNGTETDINDRGDWKTNPTTLSGDIGTVGYDNDNCYHIIIAAGSSTTSDNATLDGFVITGAYSVDLGAANASTINNKSVPRWSAAGIYINGMSFSMSNLDICQNAAGGYGGGIYADGNNNGAVVKLTNSTIRGNRASTQGGGMYSNNTSWPMTNVLFSGNTAATGGAISFGSGSGTTPTLINVTIAGNYASTNSGSNSGGIIGGGVAALYNTIIWGNTMGTSTNITNGIVGSATCHNCLIQGTPTLSGLNNLTLERREDIIFNNLVKITNLADNNINGDYTLRFISPAIDAGDNSYVMGATSDLVGKGRRYNSGTVDMGAYEYQGDAYSGNFYVKEGATGQGYSWNNASGDLQLMIDMAAIKGDTVFVAEGRYVPQEIRNDKGTAVTGDGGLTSNDYAFVLRPNVKIFGGFSSSAIDGDGMDTRNWLTFETILDGDENGDGIGDRHHVVLSVLDGGNSATLDGFIITGGNSPSSVGITRISINGQNVIRRTGAGIYAFYAAPTLNNLDIRDNYASGYGGGLCVEYAHIVSAALTNSKIRGNTAAMGGGGIADMANTKETLYINVAITDNTATGGSGGGLHTTSAAVRLTNATIANNQASSGGDGLRTSGSAILQNSIVWNNSVTGNTAYSYSIVSDLDLSNYGHNLDGNLFTATQIFENASTSINYLLRDYRLIEGSPCVNAGNNSFNPTATDLDKHVRVFNDIIDMGAYESPYKTISIMLVVDDYAPVTGEKTITITGSTLLADGMSIGDVWVTLCGIPATIVSAKSNEIVCIAWPSNFAMLGSIEIFNGIQSREFPKHFTYYPVKFTVNGNWSEAYNWDKQTDDRILPFPDAAVHIMANCLQDIDVTVDSVTVYPLKAYTLEADLTANVFTLTDNASFVNNGTMGALEQNVVRTLEKGRNWYISLPTQSTSPKSVLGTGTSGGDLTVPPNTWRIQQSGMGGWTDATIMSTGQGYVAYSANEDIAAKFSGTYNDGNQSSQTLTRTGSTNGFNLLGNPFPSYWRWTEEAAAAAGLYSTIWYRTLVDDGYEFWSYNAAGGVSVAPGWSNNTPDRKSTRLNSSH